MDLDDDVAAALLAALAEEPGDDDHEEPERDGDRRVEVSLWLSERQDDAPAPVLRLSARLEIGDLDEGVRVTLPGTWAAAVGDTLDLPVDDAVARLGTFLHRHLQAAATAPERWRVVGEIGLLRVAHEPDERFTNPRTGEDVTIAGGRRAMFVDARRARAAVAGDELETWATADVDAALARCGDPHAIERGLARLPADLRLQLLPHEVHDDLVAALAYRYRGLDGAFAITDHGGEPRSPDEYVVWCETDAGVRGVPALGGRPRVPRPQWDAAAGAVAALHRLARGRVLAPADATRALDALYGLVPPEVAAPLAPLLACLPF